MKVALYARVSTEKKEGKVFVQDPEVQLRELRAYCDAKKWEMDGVYIDRASGAKESRPELNRLMDDVSSKKFDAIIVWRFDRFARSASHLLKALKTFNDASISFISTTEGVDTSTAMGKMVFTILGAVAEMERAVTIERINAGIRKAQDTGTKSGLPIGSPRNPLTTKDVKQRRAAGESVAQIAESLGISRALVYKRLKAA
jgi:DNA invertase Pin-like site-specific DNA recombinase